MKQVGGNRQVTFARKAFRHIPDVRIDPEGFVIDQQAGAGVRIFRAGHVARMAVPSATFKVIQSVLISAIEFSFLVRVH